MKIGGTKFKILGHKMLKRSKMELFLVKAQAGLRTHSRQHHFQCQGTSIKDVRTGIDLHGLSVSPHGKNKNFGKTNQTIRCKVF